MDMQTFLPHQDFGQTAKCLDWQRLGKQRVETRTIIDVLEGRVNAWKNHPAVQMWAGYEGSLRLYCNVIIGEWVSRGYRNTMDLYHTTDSRVPEWMGDPRLHGSHRAALLAKLPEHYGRFGWTEIPKIDYWWPTK